METKCIIEGFVLSHTEHEFTNQKGEIVKYYRLNMLSSSDQTVRIPATPDLVVENHKMHSILCEVGADMRGNVKIKAIKAQVK